MASSKGLAISPASGDALVLAAIAAQNALNKTRFATARYAGLAAGHPAYTTPRGSRGARGGTPAATTPTPPTVTPPPDMFHSGGAHTADDTRMREPDELSGGKRERELREREICE